MNRKRSFLVMSLFLCVFAQSTVAYAWGGPPRYFSGPHIHYAARDAFPFFAAATMVVAGIEYYYWRGEYYRRAPSGYIVVQEPQVIVVEKAAEKPPQIITTTDTDSFTVNIPNTKSGYTAVVLKRSGTGFIGPQGEYYTEFPRLEQLKVMYAK